MKINDVLKSELELIRVSEEDILNLKKVAFDFIGLLEKENLEARIGGSLAKGTMIRKFEIFESGGRENGVRKKGNEVGNGENGDGRFANPKLRSEGAQDIDIFVLFDYGEDILKLENILRKIKLPGDLKVVHGSRDYFHVDCGNVILEIVPVVRNKDPEIAENVTDMSLSHVDYVRGKIEDNPDLADEIRLAKAFCQANGFYGAEGYVRGFSGYSLEVLVIYFGGFVNFLKGVSKKRIIDSEKYFRNEKEIMREINSSKLQGPLVVVDPTYKYRNICAGLGLATFERFLERSEEFLKKPSLEFFEKREVDLDEIRSFASKKKARFLELKLSTDRQSGDIAGTKMRKIFLFFVRELERRGQVVLRMEFDYAGKGQEAFGYLVVLEKEFFERRGPSVGLEKQAKAFVEASGKENVFEKKGFWWVRERVLIEGVLDFVKRNEGEMGAEISLM